MALEPILPPFFHDLVAAAWRYQAGGWRQLERDEFRCSSAGYCSIELMHDKLWHPPDPATAPPQMEPQDVPGYFKLEGSAAAEGTSVHLTWQEPAKRAGFTVELFVRHAFAGITETGHVDIAVPEHLGAARETGDRFDDWQAIVDIKACDGRTFDLVTGVAAPKDPSRSYSLLKRQLSIEQVNEYNIITAAPVGYIMYVNRNNGVFALERVEQSKRMHQAVFKKYANVFTACIRRANDIEKDALPPPAGSPLCLASPKYCRHHRDYAGWNKSPANCPGAIEVGFQAPPDPAPATVQVIDAGAWERAFKDWT